MNSIERKLLCRCKKIIGKVYESYIDKETIVDGRKEKYKQFIKREYLLEEPAFPHDERLSQTNQTEFICLTCYGQMSDNPIVQRSVVRSIKK